MPRPREFDPDQVLRQAMELFWEQGYEGTSVEELVARTGVNRFSLYSTFGSKRELFLQALDCYRDRAVGDLFGLVVERSDQGLAAIRRYFRTLLELTPEQRRVGCLMVNTATEISTSDPDVTERFEAHFERMEVGFRDCLERARENGELAADGDPEELARFLVGVAAGLAALSRAGLPEPALEDHVHVALRALEKNRTS